MSDEQNVRRESGSKWDASRGAVCEMRASAGTCTERREAEYEEKLTRNASQVKHVIRSVYTSTHRLVHACFRPPRAC